jgi:hypothetical protein
MSVIFIDLTHLQYNTSCQVLQAGCVRKSALFSMEMRPGTLLAIYRDIRYN